MKFYIKRFNTRILINCLANLIYKNLIYKNA